MKTCDKDGTPCLHEPCLESQGIKCCEDCDFGDTCASKCFKAKATQERNTSGGDAR